MSLRIYVVLAAFALPLLASSQETDPPGRVARLSYIRGDVSFQAADGQTPETATLNRPVTAGDRLMTGSGARSELTLGVAAIRLDEHTDLSIANLDEEIAQLEINSGTLSVHVRELENGQTVQIDTPNSTVQLLEPGDYRVEIAPEGTVFVDVRSGNAEVDAGNGPVRLRDGQQARLATGDAAVDIRNLGRPDDFDNWAMDRERQLNGEETSRYVSREVVGYEDLDDYGDWRVEPEYGAVWIPRVAVGWAPYRFGHWAWISPWGWTWIDHASWGFAPFHYGRWTYLRSRWCWVPGPRYYRPIYAPALVAWVGDPYSGISLSISSGPIGWFALGPREVYVPHRHVSPRYLRNVNISNTTIVNNTYITNVARGRVKNIHHANRNAPGAFTSRPRREFDSRRPGENREREWRADRNRDDRTNRNGIVRLAREANPNPNTRNVNTGVVRDIGSRLNDRNGNTGRDRNRDNSRRDLSQLDRTRSARTDDGADHRPSRDFNRDRAASRSFERSRPSQTEPRTEPRTERMRRDREPRDFERSMPDKRHHAYRTPDRTREVQRPERRAERREAPSRSSEPAGRSRSEGRSEPRSSGNRAANRAVVVPQNKSDGGKNDRRGAKDRQDRR